MGKEESYFLAGHCLQTPTFACPLQLMQMGKAGGGSGAPASSGSAWPPASPTRQPLQTQRGVISHLPELFSDI